MFLHMSSIFLLKILALFCAVHFGVIDACGRSRVTLTDNEYKNLVISISESVPENTELVERIKNIFTLSSDFLFNVTRRRAVFREISILIPSTWSDKIDYEVPTFESHDTSDIVVDLKNAESGNTPFTVKATPCGEPGEFIRLTSEYLLNDEVASSYGSYEKAITHEWAHLRWGVFDEYPTEVEENFYFTATGDVEGSRCVSDIQGKLINSIGGECQILDETGLIDWDCHFEEDLSQLNYFGSMMYKQFLANVDMFCDDQDVNHNKEAPVMQNKICDFKSVWQVMSEHGDFCCGYNSEVDDNEFSTVPIFHVVKQLTKRTVLVLDISNSMNDDEKLTRLRQASSNYILNNVGEDEQLGIVTFNRYANVTSYLKTVANISVRNDLKSNLPTEAFEATSIAAGLLKGIEVLEEGGKDASGGNLLLITDGKEFNAPWIEDEKQNIYDSGVIIDTIAISQEADSKIEALASNTGGISFYYSVNTESNALNEALTAISERGQSDLDQGILLFSNSLEISSNDQYSESIEIDSTVGMDTEFTFHYIQSMVNVKLYAPDGSIIDNNSNSSYQIDEEFETIRIAIPGEALVGKWLFDVTNPSSLDVSCSISISTHARYDEQYPIIAMGKWKNNEVIPPEENNALYVTVSKGYTPVLNAVVIAEIERPSGSKVEILLNDQGTGADMKKYDGIYSSYFTEFNSNSTERYSTKVKVQSSEDTLMIPGTKVGVGASYNMAAISFSEQAAEKVESFQRVLSPNTFQCNGEYCGDANFDLYGPTKIHNLVATKIDLSVPSVTIEFTATGDNLDQGKAAHYLIKQGRTFDDLYENFNVATKVAEEEILSSFSDINQPKISGESESFEIKVSEIGNLSYYFAVAAVDNDGKEASMSNIVSASMKFNTSLTSTTAAAATIVTPEMKATVETTETTFLSTSIIAGFPVNPSASTGIPYYIIYLLIAFITFVIILVLLFVCYNKRKRKLDQNKDSLNIVDHESVEPNIAIGVENWQLQEATIDEGQVTQSPAQNALNLANSNENANVSDAPAGANMVSANEATSKENPETLKSTSEESTNSGITNATPAAQTTENDYKPEVENSDQTKDPQHPIKQLTGVLKSKNTLNERLNMSSLYMPSPKPYRMVTGSKPASHFNANRNFAHGQSVQDPLQD